MNLETVVLGFLNEGPMTGYDLSKKIDASVGFFWHATHPQIYTCLKSLAARGLAGFEIESQESGPARKVYSITAQGKQQVLQDLSEEIKAHEVKFPLLVAMYHGSELGREHWLRVLESQLMEQKSKLLVYENIQKELPVHVAARELDIFLKLRTVEFGIGYQKHFINWLEETVAALRK